MMKVEGGRKIGGKVPDGRDPRVIGIGRHSSFGQGILPQGAD